MPKIEGTENSYEPIVIQTLTHACFKNSNLLIYSFAITVISERCKPLEKYYYAQSKNSCRI